MYFRSFVAVGWWVIAVAAAAALWDAHAFIAAFLCLRGCDGSNLEPVARRNAEKLKLCSYPSFRPDVYLSPGPKLHSAFDRERAEELLTRKMGGAIVTSPTSYWRQVWKLEVGLMVNSVLSHPSVFKLLDSIFGCVSGSGMLHWSNCCCFLLLSKWTLEPIF